MRRQPSQGTHPLRVERSRGNLVTGQNPEAAKETATKVAALRFVDPIEGAQGQLTSDLTHITRYNRVMNEILELRRAAGISQAELAARSGVAQPNVAAYEAGRRRPSPRMIERIRAALRPRPREALAAHRQEVVAVLARYQMTGVKVFGSVVHGTDGPGSDLDLLVDFPADGDLLDLIDGAAAVEELLGIPVDVVTSRSIEPDHPIARTAVPL